MGRRSVWSDPRLIKIASRFVPATDEVWRLQRGNDDECRFFQRFADQGHYQRSGGTRQGIYVCAPSGKLLASGNTLNADRVLAMLQQALEKWKALPDGERGLPADANLKPGHRWEDSFPSGGLVLVSTNRDLPPNGDPAARAGDRWNRDHVWFSQNEARQWLPADPRPGRTHRLPKILALRLARFHLVDNVRGQTLPFAAEEVRAARLEVEVTERTGTQVRLKIRGATHARADGPWRMGDSHWKPPREYPRGVTTRLLGRATYDLERGVFIEFELVALGQRWGFTQNNARRGNAERSPIGFFFGLAPAGEPRIAPAFIDVYNADWVVRPETGD